MVHGKWGSQFHFPIKPQSFITGPPSLEMRLHISCTFSCIKVAKRAPHARTEPPAEHIIRTNLQAPHLLGLVTP